MNHRAQAAGSDTGRRVVVEAREVSKRYARNWALKAVDLRVEGGELVSLLGPNGSGKSTLLRVLTGVTRPTYGSVELFGAPPKTSNGKRQHLGVLPPQSYLYGELTALENLNFAAVMYGLKSHDDELVEALAHVGLEQAADRQVRTFSSGMRKRLALARATLHDPELVLLDEPYGALDVEGIGWVDAFVGELREAGKTLVIATHEIGRALALCDRAVSLRGGRVVYDGPTSSYEGAVSGATDSVRMEAKR
ncbi:MAG: ABC transporter ATP-binding protein [Gemmatimonadetes bacterium]|uniref:ABC transporter ATP-binding protein n=1 Tax=Candidatus Kutchimonas denitrificans TaxID=3056748 RepID=A0AAE4ZCR4_9BACT|nr:ABC transporter ATP-binding protein [Gemmatimonadota bacterium]NIR76151.1 ABC transporter ATP-binding protein [Candidatus Kutchimonas denitrificans]NIS00530.1 ABC transporter ATP-binding protein [Gemmatimonadota bacterium]NIT66188.1 ABC transporter ATP-binding protein [Gemmatimonadota bacterium]NIU54266.1 ATP-binding cassette domain-containing protein [Gemmatimonadota bacterium]